MESRKQVQSRLLVGTIVGSGLFLSAAASSQTPPTAPNTPSAGATTTPTPMGSATAGGTANDIASSQPNAGSVATSSAAADIVVTGSRIVRNGYTAPTPVTVVSTEQLQRSAPGAIPEGLNQLPQFAGSRNNQTVNGAANSPAGGNYLNLRNLGSIRTLILLDGQRLPPTSFDGTVDANIVPQALVSRVEVVTGGASAAYGSDAVSGVINFILDTKFNGLKGQAQGGISKYGDADTYKFNLAGGFGLLENRVHVLFSYDHYQQKGIPNNLERPYGYLNLLRTGTGTAANPYIDNVDVRYATATYGTLISFSGTTNAGNPLRGTQFVSGGVVIPFNPGTPTGTSGYNIGGDGVISFGKTLTGTQNTDQGFGRVDVDLGRGITAFAQGTYANSFNSYITIGSGTQIGDFQIFTENPFLSDSVRTTLANANVRSFVASRIEADQPPKLGRFYNNVVTIVSGVKGKVGKFDWSLGYSHGDSNLHVAHEGNFDNARWLAALDAVRDSTGRVVCRITITNPTLQPNCVPINIFGNGSPSKAAYDYVAQVSRYRVKQKMDIFTANVSGDLFNLPAGPVSVAAGAEYRRQKLLQTSNSDPTRSIDLTGLRTNVPTFVLQYNSTNVGFAQGDLNVKEAYGEIAVPVLKDSAIGTLDFNGAVRYTDYSTSGSVETWKGGISYQPIESLRIRATKSRDIRAPTLYELYAGPTASRGQFNDLHTGLNNNVISYTQGNAALKPEKGDTFTGGVVYSPTFVPRLSMSVDYYSVKIKKAIGTLSFDTIQAQCEASNGTADVCSAILRPLPFADRSPANFPNATLSIPFNQAAVKIRGIDYEISYRLPLGRMIFDNATVDFRLIGGHLLDYTSQSSATAAVIQSDNAGNNIKDRINLQIGYRDGAFSLDPQIRYYGKHKKTQDPTVFYVDNHVKAVTYADLTAQYRFKVGGVAFEVYGTVNNIFDTQPPLYGQGGQPGQSYPTNTAVYDVIGRFYTGGVRARF